MGFNMRLLLFLVPIYPNLSRVLFCSDQFSLLVDLVQKLLPLNVILFLQRFLLDLKRVCLPLDLNEFILLFIKFLLEEIQHLVTIQIGLLDRSVLFLQLSQALLGLLPHIICHLQVTIQALIVVN